MVMVYTVPLAELSGDQTTVTLCVNRSRLSTVCKCSLKHNKRRAINRHVFHRDFTSYVITPSTIYEVNAILFNPMHFQELKTRPMSLYDRKCHPLFPQCLVQFSTWQFNNCLCTKISKQSFWARQHVSHLSHAKKHSVHHHHSTTYATVDRHKERRRHTKRDADRENSKRLRQPQKAPHKYLVEEGTCPQKSRTLALTRRKLWVVLSCAPATYHHTYHYTVLPYHQLINCSIKLNSQPLD